MKQKIFMTSLLVLVSTFTFAQQGNVLKREVNKYLISDWEFDYF